MLPFFTWKWLRIVGSSVRNVKTRIVRQVKLSKCTWPMRTKLEERTTIHRQQCSAVFVQRASLLFKHFTSMQINCTWISYQASGSCVRNVTFIFQLLTTWTSTPWWRTVSVPILSTLVSIVQSPSQQNHVCKSTPITGMSMKWYVTGTSVQTAARIFSVRKRSNDIEMQFTILAWREANDVDGKTNVPSATESSVTSNFSTAMSTTNTP